MRRQDRQTEQRVAVQAFSKITLRWGLAPSESCRLVNAPMEVMNAWFDRPERAQIKSHQLKRISYVLGIYIALQAMYAGIPYADDWLKRSNKDFDERTPLERMLDGMEGLADVHRYLLHAAYVIW